MKEEHTHGPDTESVSLHSTIEERRSRELGLSPEMNWLRSWEQLWIIMWAGELGDKVCCWLALGSLFSGRFHCPLTTTKETSASSLILPSDFIQSDSI